MSAIPTSTIRPGRNEKQRTDEREEAVQDLGHDPAPGEWRRKPQRLPGAGLPAQVTFGDDEHRRRRGHRAEPHEQQRAEHRQPDVRHPAPGSFDVDVDQRAVRRCRVRRSAPGSRSSAGRAETTCPESHRSTAGAARGGSCSGSDLDGGPRKMAAAEPPGGKGAAASGERGSGRVDCRLMPAPPYPRPARLPPAHGSRNAGACRARSRDRRSRLTPARGDDRHGHSLRDRALRCCSSGSCSRIAG